MATTTNFGWETPDDTDLVKDGASAIRTLGGAIDTSLVDLKGGTTGQVLSKASNTDMDFSWTADAGIPATIIDAKGDLIVGSAADTAARLAVGTNNHVLTADSTATNGVKWAAVSVSSAFVNISTTTLNTGSSYTISNLGGYDKLRFFFDSISNSGTTAPVLNIQFNSDTGSNYTRFGSEINGGTTDDYNSGTSTTLPFARQSTTAGDAVFGYLEMNGCNGTDDKIGLVLSGASGTTSKRSYRYGFRYNASAAITSITVSWAAGNFDGGTLDIWGSIN